MDIAREIFLAIAAGAMGFGLGQLLISIRLRERMSSVETHLENNGTESKQTNRYLQEVIQQNTIIISKM